MLSLRSAGLPGDSPVSQQLVEQCSREHDPSRSFPPRVSLSAPLQEHECRRVAPPAAVESTATRQLDFVFASASLAEQITVRALSAIDEWDGSDQCPNCHRRRALSTSRPRPGPVSRRRRRRPSWRSGRLPAGSCHWLRACVDSSLDGPLGWWASASPSTASPSPDPESTSATHVMR
jgi:hypothetical protein